MYCPKCSQEQPSESLRFCSRCGFPLAGVAVLLGNDGTLPQPEQSSRNSSQRAQIIKESVLFTFGAWTITVVAMMLWNWGGAIETAAKVGALIFFLLGIIGLLRFVFAFLFVKVGDSKAEDRAFPAVPRRESLPPPQAVPLSDYPRANTREMVPRVSVTENTTRLLDEE